jgi:hypothetical protein
MLPNLCRSLPLREFIKTKNEFLLSSDIILSSLLSMRAANLFMWFSSRSEIPVIIEYHWCLSTESTLDMIIRTHNLSPIN